MKKVYLDILSNKLKSVQTNQRVNTSEMEIFASHDSFNNKHSIKLEDNFNIFPTFHWLPTSLQMTYKIRYIVNSRSCSTTELSVRMTSVLKGIKTHMKSTVIKFMRTLGLAYFGL